MLLQSREHILEADHRPSYFVTELLGTDLHRLLTSRPLEKQFIQYFLYQILVGHTLALPVCTELTRNSVGSDTYTRQVLFIAT